VSPGTMPSVDADLGENGPAWRPWRSRAPRARRRRAAPTGGAQEAAQRERPAVPVGRGRTRPRDRVLGLVGQERLDPLLQLLGHAGEGQAGVAAERHRAASPRERRAGGGSEARPSAAPPPRPRRRSVGEHLGVAGLGGQQLGGCRRRRPPSSSSTTRSARAMVDSRWAMTSVVRPADRRSSASWISPRPHVDGAGGVVEDEDGGLASSVRAMAMRWRCPPDSV
jgi:hypothetical protein